MNSYPFMPCECLKMQLGVWVAVGMLLEEAKELVEARTVKEAVEEGSDVMFALGRLLGAVVGKLYVRVPGAGMTERKMALRLLDHGCVRSLRNFKRVGCGPTERRIAC